MYKCNLCVFLALQNYVVNRIGLRGVRNEPMLASNRNESQNCEHSWAAVGVAPIGHNPQKGTVGVTWASDSRIPVERGKAGCISSICTLTEMATRKYPVRLFQISNPSQNGCGLGRDWSVVTMLFPSDLPGLFGDSDRKEIKQQLCCCKWWGVLPASGWEQW